MNESVPDSSLYDWTQAEVLFGPQSEPVPEDMVELIGEMVRSVMQRLQELLNYSAEQFTSEQTNRELHQLRGNLLNFGFVGVAAQIRHLECPTSTLTAEHYQQQLQNIQTTFRTNLQALGLAYPNLQPTISF